MSDQSYPSPFAIIPPTGSVVPIVVSVPHCGPDFPPELQGDFLPEHIEWPDDTDWFVHQLYDFAPAMGITLLHSRYCRYVVDLNRSPDDVPLYNDGRNLTGLTPAQTFLGEPLYRDSPPDAAEVQRRLGAYYWPYHHALKALLASHVEASGRVLLWEAHSIRRSVPTIRTEPFPDLILGDQDGRTAAPNLSDLAATTLQRRYHGLQRNEPFKGGYITRSFGAPAEGIHAIQLEMAKDLYMDDAEREYAPDRADQVRVALQETFAALSTALVEMS